MRILLNISHPAHVHLFKNCIWKLEQLGHSIKITAIEKEITSHLLKIYGIDYNIIGKSRPTLISKAFELIQIETELYKIARLFHPDVLLGGVGNVYVTHIGKLIRKPSIIFDDTEHAKIEHVLMDPFASVICTPSCYTKNLGKKQIKYNGYHELAYLHPNYFTPDPTVLDEVGLSRDDPFIVMRFVSWQASHDVGQHGIRDKVGMVKELEKYGRVLITSEGRLPKDLQPYQIRISPEKLHDLLYYATLYVGEGATTASECAVLGTHAIYVNTLRLGYIAEEDKRYQLVSDFSSRICNDVTVLAEAKRLLQNPNLKNDGKKKGEMLVMDKIDVTAFMVWFVENYPDSFAQIKAQPEIQEKFRSN